MPWANAEDKPAALAASPIETKIFFILCLELFLKPLTLIAYFKIQRPIAGQIYQPGKRFVKTIFKKLFAAGQHKFLELMPFHHASSALLP
jgi:hypothetical protein